MVKNQEPVETTKEGNTGCQECNAAHLCQAADRGVNPLTRHWTRRRGKKTFLNDSEISRFQFALCRDGSLEESSDSLRLGQKLEPI
jgi:hypothetical protein